MRVQNRVRRGCWSAVPGECQVRVGRQRDAAQPVGQHDHPVEDHLLGDRRRRGRWWWRWRWRGREQDRRPDDHGGPPVHEDAAGGVHASQGGEARDTRRTQADDRFRRGRAGRPGSGGHRPDHVRPTQYVRRQHRHARLHVEALHPTRAAADHPAVQSVDPVEPASEILPGGSVARRCGGCVPHHRDLACDDHAGDVGRDAASTRRPTVADDGSVGQLPGAGGQERRIEPGPHDGHVGVLEGDRSDAVGAAGDAGPERFRRLGEQHADFGAGDAEGRPGCGGAEGVRRAVERAEDANRVVRREVGFDAQLVVGQQGGAAHLGAAAGQGRDGRLGVLDLGLVAEGEPVLGGLGEGGLDLLAAAGLPRLQQGHVAGVLGGAALVEPGALGLVVGVLVGVVGRDCGGVDLGAGPAFAVDGVGQVVAGRPQAGLVGRRECRVGDRGVVEHRFELGPQDAAVTGPALVVVRDPVQQPRELGLVARSAANVVGRLVRAMEDVQLGGREGLPGHRERQACRVGGREELEHLGGQCHRDGRVHGVTARPRSPPA